MDQDVTFVLIVAIVILLVQEFVETIEISLLGTVEVVPPVSVIKSVQKMKI